jgi:outer membrane protein assembly factor BamA
MRRAVVIAVLMTAWLLAAGPASARQYLGQTVADVRVEVSGVPVTEPAVIELIETRIGEPLSMFQVRSTIDHLVGLGRFEDVRVFTSPSDQGVIVRWVLTPVQRIGTIEINGDAEVGEQAIRAELTDRFGAAPSTSRVAEMVAALATFYADRGFHQAEFLPRIEDQDSQPERVKLVLTITAGARASIRAVTVTTPRT